MRYADMPCPICDKASEEKFKPFCSLRCKEVDLGKWLTGSYTVPVVEMDDVDDIDLDTESGEE